MDEQQSYQAGLYQRFVLRPIASFGDVLSRLFHRVVTKLSGIKNRPLRVLALLCGGTPLIAVLATLLAATGMVMLFWLGVYDLYKAHLYIALQQKEATP